MLTCRSGCERQFRSKEAMDKHCEASHGILVCTKGCRRQFKTLSGRKDHERVAHLPQPGTTRPASQATENKPAGYFSCRNGCQRSFATTDGRDNHEEVSHGIPRRSRTLVAGCNECGKEFASYEALRQHQDSSAGHTRPASAIGSSGCGHCNRTLRNQEALEQHFVADHSLIRIDNHHGEGAELVRSFRQDWRKQTITIPNVLFVYRIYNLGWRIHKFKAYKASIPTQANVLNRYHGTTVQCELGAGTSTKLCQNITCGLCGIIRSGFKTAKARSGWQRFGPGIYTTATSSKSNDYVRTNSTTRAVLVCEVVAGNAFRTNVSMPDLKGPPEGYHSVWGEVGMDLNYDETVIYKSKAILPRFLLIYRI